MRVKNTMMLNEISSLIVADKRLLESIGINIDLTTTSECVSGNTTDITFAQYGNDCMGTRTPENKTIGSSKILNNAEASLENIKITFISPPQMVADTRITSTTSGRYIIFELLIEPFIMSTKTPNNVNIHMFSKRAPKARPYTIAIRFAGEMKIVSNVPFSRSNFICQALCTIDQKQL